MTALLAKACGVALAQHPVMYAGGWVGCSWVLGWECVVMFWGRPGGAGSTSKGRLKHPCSWCCSVDRGLVC
jgi:hypothetical protein